MSKDNDFDDLIEEIEELDEVYSEIEETELDLERERIMNDLIKGKCIEVEDC